MAALTWREVSAPDLSTSLRGYETFSRLMSNAFGGAQDALKEFDTSQDEIANREAMSRALAIRDTDAYKTALSSGSILDGISKNRLSTQTLAALDSRVGTLLNQATAEQNLNDTKYASAQGKAADALAPEVTAVEALRYAGKPDAARETALRDRFGAVGLRTSMDINKALMSAETTGLGNDQTRLGMDNTRLNMRQTEQNMSFAKDEHDWAVTDRNDRKMGEAAFLEMQAGSYSPESALEAFSSPRFKGLTPGAKMFALQQMNQNWGNIYQPAQLAQMAGMPAAGSGADGMNVMNYQARNGGFAAVPASIKTMGDASAYADRINASGIPSSAMGPFQIVGNTRDSYAKKLFGNGWQSQPYSLDNEKRIATAIFNDNRGSAAALRKQWVSLSQADAERIRQLPAEQALAFIAQKESGGSPFAVAVGAQVGQAQERIGRSDASARIQAAASGSNNPREVVDGLMKGAFAGSNRTYVQSQIQSIVDRSKVNGKPTIGYAEAGVILNDGLRVNNDSWGITNWANNNSVRLNKRGDRLDFDYINGEIERGRSGNLVQDATRTNDVNTALATQSVAQQALAQARAEYVAAERRKLIQPGIDTTRLKAKMDAAQAAATRANSAVEQISRPRQQPVATTTGEPTGSGFFGGLFNIRREQ